MFLGYNVNVFIFVHIDADDDFQVPDWHVGQCQSGTWRKSNSGSTVITGRIANGQQIPLPTGFSASQCSWSVSNAENPQGWKPNYFAGSVATYDANRIVKCGFYDEYNFHKGHLELI
uniref:hypothetical protein n=1 Tax=Salmonella enterica TaxID=28901 RepID=UPI002015E8E1|nr:hypothetical protein [Salmonella enterica]